MMFLFEIVATIVSVLILLPIGLLFIQTLYALKISPPQDSISCIKSSSIILIPAHNEALSIEKSLSSIISQLSAHDKVLVVADNCSDDTAKLVANMGIQVLERNNTELKGKSYAIDYGIKYLMNAPPDIVVILDADCIIHEGNITDLINTCSSVNRPVQGLYLMNAPKNSSIKTKISAFAWLLKNHIRAKGYNYIGMPCQLMGSGMAFPWSLISTLELATGSIVEDLEMGLKCAERQQYPLFYPEFCITSEFPSNPAVEAGQRTRWEHGHMAIILKEIPNLIKRAFILKDARFAAMVLDAAVPPLSLISLTQLLMILISLCITFIGIFLPLYLSISSSLLLLVVIIISWLKFGRDTISARELLSIPHYIISKIPMYLKFIYDRQLQWVKTKRD